MKIVTDRLNEQEIAIIQDIALEANIVLAASEEDLLREIEYAEVILGPKLAPAQLAHAKQVKWIQVAGVGIDRMISPELVASDIVLTNSKGKTSVNIAEHAFALLLALSRKIPYALRWQQKNGHREGEKPKPQILELAGETLGLIGLGNVGREIAKRAHGFSMNVLAVDSSQGDKPDTVTRVLGSDGLHAMLAQCDFVIVCCPLTPETNRLLGFAEFQLMKKSAFLINVARGKIVDQTALTEALQNGAIAGAGLDVTFPEPLPPDHPLWAMDNVILTPHWAGTSPKSWDRVFPLFCENLRRYLAGEPLLNVVDKARGY